MFGMVYKKFLDTVITEVVKRLTDAIILDKIIRDKIELVSAMDCELELGVAKRLLFSR